MAEPAWTREDVRCLLHDLDRFVRDVECGTAGDASEIAERSVQLQRRLDVAEAWLDGPAGRGALDFDAIIARCFDQPQIARPHDVEAAPFVEALRQVWNARGAADLDVIGRELSSQMGATAAGPYVKNLDRALRSVDR